MITCMNLYDTKISYKHMIHIMHNYMMFETQKHGRPLPDVGGSTIGVGIIVINVVASTESSIKITIIPHYQHTKLLHYSYVRM